ncbi:MAG: tyrosine-type recombinase/integrase [Kiritimatiellaeota bacterium]|nr:tyrosine-type recombinase/integrase [Kiritimatiellota bacterium]
MSKVFKRGKYYYYRLSVNGRDTWKSTKQTNKDEAAKIADKYADAHHGRGNVEEFFQALMQRIGTLPENERADTRQRLARRMMMTQQHALALADAWQVWSDSPMKGNPGPSTVTSYSGYWKRFQAWAAGGKLEFMHEITPSHADEYARDLWRDKVSPRTFNGHITFLRAMFTTLKSPAGLFENPWAAIKAMEKRTQGRMNFTPEELTVICHKATGAMRYMIAVGLYTGLRLSDVINLKWANIRPGRIELMPGKTARKGKTITIPLHPVLDLLLQERRTQVVGEYVFPDEIAQNARAHSGVSKRFQAFLEDCGIVTTEAKGEHRQLAIVRKGFHSLRHSFVSLCAANRVPQVAIQDLVGHGSPAMTALYSHADFEQKTAAIATLPAMGFDNNGGTQ